MLLSEKKILLVEDEEFLRDSTKEELEYYGAAVFTASNGKEALSLCHSNLFDAIVSDVRMPGGDGIEFLASIQKVYSVMPVFIFLTGFTDMSIEEAYLKGASRVYSKPFDLEDMVKTLALLIDQKSSS